ncbi:MAG: ComEA family DNA-binding protein [Gemmatimonadaceae bacterium]
MATPAERKALLFFALVAALGAGVRLWRARHVDNHVTASAEIDDSYSDGAPRVPAHGSTRAGGKPRKGGSRITSQGGSAATRSSSSRTSSVRGSRSGQIVRDLGATVDATVDIDRASMSEIDALGVLQPGVARLIVADRDSFGPFGSIQELERIPFLSTAVIRKLAPRVTFSRLPRPKNTVIQPRSRDANAVVVRRAHKGKGSAQ